MDELKKKKGFDWVAIYADWLAGEMSNQAIARKHGCTAQAIGQKAQRDGWTGRIGPDGRPIVIERPVPATAERPPGKPDVTKEQTPAQLRKRAKRLAQRLLAEVEDVTTYEGEIAEIILKEETDPVRRRAALKAISVDVRIKNLRELTAVIDAVDGKRVSKMKSDEADEPKGKKAQRQKSAEKASSSGVFAVPAPPRLVVNG